MLGLFEEKYANIEHTTDLLIHVALLICQMENSN